MNSNSNLRRTEHASIAARPVLWLDKRGRRVCWCGGYWFPHRRGGGTCDHSKSRDVHLARRTGNLELQLTAHANYAWEHAMPHPKRWPIPF